METAEARLAFMTGLRRPLSKADRKEKYTPGCVPQPSSIKTRMKHYRLEREEVGETTFFLRKPDFSVREPYGFSVQ